VYNSIYRKTQAAHLLIDPNCLGSNGLVAVGQ